MFAIWAFNLFAGIYLHKHVHWKFSLFIYVEITFNHSILTGIRQSLRPDFTSKLVHVLAFGTPKFYIRPYDKIKRELVNLSSNCDVKSGLSLIL